MGKIWLEEDKGRNSEERRGNSKEKTTISEEMERERKTFSEESDLRKAECAKWVTAHK